jgi:hypothetical protein
MAADIRTAEPGLALKMHLASAGCISNRCPHRRWLRELAARSNSTRPRLTCSVFEALAHSQLEGKRHAARARFVARRR